MTKSLAESLGPYSNPLRWAHDFLYTIGAPATESNLVVLYSWQFSESGGGGGKFNPLNTVQPWPVGGPPVTTNYNSIGVKNYPTYEIGLAATARVMHDSAYRSILFSFRIGDSLEDLVFDITQSIWGTHTLHLRTLPELEIKERDMIIQKGRKSTVAGHTPYITVAMDGQHLECHDGARLINDVPTDDPNVFIWRPKNLGEADHIASFCERVSEKADPASGGEVRKGLLVIDNHGNPHNGFFK